LITEHFPDDAQGVGDPEWVEYGLAHGWSLLTQDDRIRRQPSALAPLRRYKGTVHCLASAELPREVRAERFHTHQRKIYGNVRAARLGFFVVYEFDVVRRWP
jgi:hypothetical protein